MNTLANPYIGPRTFQRDEGHLFFGREREARDLISLVASERLVVFYAQSGAGKSSIVNTRLLPNLETKEYEVLPVGRVSGDIADDVKVENIYIYNLIRSLQQHEIDPGVLAKLSLSEFLCQLNFDDKGFFYDPALPPDILPSDDPSIIRRALVIDQFEELFSTHPEAWEKRGDFFRQVAQAMQEDAHLWVVLVMREDFIAALDPYAHLVPGGLRVRYYMQRLGRDAALKAVTSPVEAIRPYARGVAEKLIDDLCSIKVERPDGTPDFQPGQYVEPVQLQVVCYGLWDNLPPDGTQITEKDLQDVGDVDQSLGKYYDKRVSDVAVARNASERLIREWFEKKLITAGGIRNMVLQDREHRPGELDDDVIQALQSDLVRAEKRGGATWYELTHDRLVEPILERNRIWFNENLSPLQRQAALWRDQDQNETWLLRDSALVEVEDWAQAHNDELTETEREFLAACKKAQAQIEEQHAAERRQLEMATQLAEEKTRSARRARVFNIIAAIAVIVALYFAFNANQQKQTAEQERQKAVESVATAEAAKIEALEQGERALSSDLFLRAQLASSQPDLQTLLYIEAFGLDPNERTESALLKSLQKYGGLKSFWNYTADQISLSPDGQTLATLDNEEGITLWSLDGLTKRNEQPVNEHFNAVYPSAFSADGRYVASASKDSSVVLWSAENGNGLQPLTAPLKEHSDWIDALVFRPDGAVLASSSDDQKIILWDLSKKIDAPTRLNTLSGHSGWIASLAFSSDGKLLASGSSDYTVRLWDVSDPENAAELSQPIVLDGVAYAVAISQDNAILAIGDGAGYVLLVDISDPEHPEVQSPITIAESDPSVYGLSFSPVNDRLLAIGSGSAIELWDISDPENPEMVGDPIHEYAGGDSSFYNSYIYSVVFSPDGKTLASSSSGFLILWDISNLEKPVELQSTSVTQKAINSISFNPVDGTRLVTGCLDGSMILWDLSDPKNPTRIGKPQKGHPGRPLEMEYSTDGSVLLSKGADGTILIDTNTGLMMGAGDIAYAGADDQVMVLDYYDSQTNENKIGLHIPNDSGTYTSIKIQGAFVAISPTSQTVAYTTIGKDGKTSLNLWDIQTGKPAKAGISGDYLSFNPDGTALAYEITDDEGETSISVIDPITGESIVRSIDGKFVSFTPDGKFLIYQTSDQDLGDYIESWDLTTRQKGQLHTAGTYETFSTDGKSLLAHTQDESGNEVLIVTDIATGIETHYTVGLLVANPDIYNTYLAGETIFFQYSDFNDNAIVNLLDTTTNEITIVETDDNSVFLSPDGETLVYYTTDPDTDQNQLNLLHLTDGSVIGEPVTGTFSTFVKLEDRQRLLYSFYDSAGNSSIALLDLDTGTPVGAPQSGLFDRLRPDNKVIIYQSNDEIKLLSAETGFPIETTSITGEILGFSSDDTQLVYQIERSDENDTLYVIGLLDTNTGRIANDITIRGSNPLLQPNGNILVSTSVNGIIYFWDLSQAGLLGTPLQNTPETIQSAVLDPAGKILATVGEEGITLQGWNSPAAGAITFNHHHGIVSSVFFSPKDGALLSVGDDGKSILWDLTKQPPTGHTIDGVGKGFSPDGQVLIVVDDRNKITQFIDANSFNPKGKPILGTETVFSPDGSIVVVSDPSQDRATLVNLTTLQRKEIREGSDAMFSPDGNFLAISETAYPDETDLWDINTNTQINQEFLGPNPTFSADGRFMITGSDEAGYYIAWQLTSSTIKQVVNVVNKKQADSELNFNMQFSPDGEYLLIEQVTQYGNETQPDAVELKLIDLNNRQQYKVRGSDPVFSGDGSYLATKDGYSIVLTGVSTRAELDLGIAGTDPVFGAEGSDLLAVSEGRNIAVWDLPGQTKLDLDIQGIGPVFSPDNKYLAVTVVDDEDQESTVLWDLDSGQSITLSGSDARFTADSKFLVNTDMVYSLDAQQSIIGDEAGNYATLRDGDLMAIYGSEGVSLWDLETSQLSDPLPGHSANISEVLFSPNGLILASMAGDGVILSDMQGKKLSQTIVGNSMSFNADGTILAVSSEAGGTILWNVAANRALDTILPGDQATFSPDGKFLKTTDSEEKNTLLWDTSTWKLLANPLPGIYSFFSEDGSKLAVLKPASTIGKAEEAIPEPAKILIWDLQSDLTSPQGTITVENPCQQEFCNKVAFSADGKYLVHVEASSSREDQYDILLWDTENDEKVILAEPIHVDSINNMSFVLGNRFGYLLLIQDLTNFTIWNVLSGTSFSEPINGSFQEQVAAADQSSLIYIRDDIQDLIRWDFAPEQWSAQMCKRVGRNFTPDEWPLIFGQRPYARTCEDWP